MGSLRTKFLVCVQLGITGKSAFVCAIDTDYRPTAWASEKSEALCFDGREVLRVWSYAQGTFGVGQACVVERVTADNLGESCDEEIEAISKV